MPPTWSVSRWVRTMWRTSSRRKPSRSSWWAAASVGSNTGRVMNRTGPTRSASGRRSRRCRSRRRRGPGRCRFRAAEHGRRTRDRGRVHGAAVEMVNLHCSVVPTRVEHFATPDLGDQARRVEVDALVDDAVAVEEEHRDDRHPERLARRRKAVELAEIGSQQVEFDDHRVVGDVVADVVVALVGERGAGQAVVPHHLVVAVEDLTRRHDLVARVAR